MFQCCSRIEPRSAVPRIHQPCHARPLPFRQPLHLTQVRAHRIQVDVVAQWTQSRVGIDHQTLVSSLKKMSAFLPQPVEANRKRPLKPAHSLGQIRSWGFHRQVIMVGHHTPGMDSPSGLRTGFIQTFPHARSHEELRNPGQSADYSRSCVSTMIVTGPSFTSVTFIDAPKVPVWTRRPRAVCNCRMNSS